MKNVTMMGMLYRVSDADYKKYLRLKSKGKDEEASQLYETWKGQGHVQELVDIGREEAMSLLEDLKEEQ